MTEMKTDVAMVKLPLKQTVAGKALIVPTKFAAMELFIVVLHAVEQRLTTKKVKFVAKDYYEMVLFYFL